MRHCFLIGHKKGGPSPFRSSHILDPIPEGPDSVRVTFSRRSPNGGPGRGKTGRNPVRNGPGTLPVGHMYGVANDHTLTGHTNGVALIGEKSIQN